MPPRRRPLSVLDLLILVAATAVGLAVTRTLPAFVGSDEGFHVYDSLEQTPSGGSSSGSVLRTRGSLLLTTGRPLTARPSYWLGHLPYWSGPCLVTSSLAAMGLALRRPRASRHRVILGAGSMPVLAMGVALLVQANRCLQGRTVNGQALGVLRNWRMYLWRHLWVTSPRLVAFGLVASWLTLWVAGRWPRRPDGPEKVGQAVGWCWIAMALSGEVGIWLFALNH